jgi:hypothetical protein
MVGNKSNYHFYWKWRGQQLGWGWFMVSDHAEPPRVQGSS